ncbi:hypothetical protein F5880DRAFT_1452973, partial [Lentinula raphanica]
HLEYASPDVRSPSPTSSVDSRHPEDQTSLSDSEGMLSPSQFERKWMDRIGLGQPSHRELEANKDPLLPRPLPGSEEERSAYQRILQDLRHEINQLHENEVFEQTMLRGPAVSQGAPAYYSHDIDAIMHSMMGQTSSNPFPNATSTPFTGPSHVDITNGPWNNYEV